LSILVVSAASVVWPLIELGSGLGKSICGAAGEADVLSAAEVSEILGSALGGSGSAISSDID
jgi:hypothetical protein